jgi:hypothetical protein
LRLTFAVREWNGIVKQGQIPEEFLTLIAEKFRMLGDSTRLANLRSLMDGARCCAYHHLELNLMPFEAAVVVW